MKLKVAGLVSSALLLFSPLSGALAAIIKPNLVHAEINSMGDVPNSGLSEYDKLLQNAGPNDGMVDWYPTKNAVSLNPAAQDIVKQLIDLSNATNDINSVASSVLFDGTTGMNHQKGYEVTYKKYQLAFGFIAQLLSFNGQATGQGAKLKQGAVAGEDPVDPRTNKSVIAGAVTETPKPGQGNTIADVLGKAIFGEEDAYAQIYINGYDNSVQNENNVIRESTSSITLVAHSKLSGKKATAIFKLNNKTLPVSPANTKLNNYRDDTIYALDGKNGNPDIAGLNMTTASPKTIDRIKLSRESTFWIDNKNGGGTIVVPRGTTAQEIAELIAQKQVAGNNTLNEIAPMKAVQAATTKEAPDGLNQIAGTNKTWADVSYNHYYEGTRLNSSYGVQGHATANGSEDYRFNYATKISFGISGPENYIHSLKKSQYREYNNAFNSAESVGLISSEYHSPLNGATRLTNDYSVTDAWFGGGYRDNYHMIDTNKLFTDGQFNIKSAQSLPNFEQSEGTPWTDDHSAQHARNMGDQDSKVAGTNDPTKTTNVGKVKHLFKPSSYFKEAYDANHFVNNSPEIQNKNVADIAKQIANNGSFSNTSVDGQIKKSFSYEVPVNSWLYKSYNNPYSTVMSSAGAQTIDGKKLSSDRSNSTIKPQKVLDLNNPNNPDAAFVKGDPTKIELFDNAYVKKIPNNEAKFTESGSGTNYLNATDKLYYYSGIYKKGTENPIYPDPSMLNDGLKVKFTDINNTISTISILPGYFRTGSKFGVIGTDSLYPDSGSGEIGGFYPIDPSNNNIENIFLGKVSLHGGSGNMRHSSINLSESDKRNYGIIGDPNQWFVNMNGGLFKNIKSWSESQYFVQTWDKNTSIKNSHGEFTNNPKPLIYNQNILGLNNNFSLSTLGQVDSPNFEAKYYIEGYFILEPSSNAGKFDIKALSVNDHLSQTAQSKRAYFNSNLYNNPKGDLTKDNTKNNSRFFVSQDFSIGPVSSDMINDAGPVGSGVNIDETYYPYSKEDPKGSSPEANAAKILELVVKYNNPLGNELNKKADSEVKCEFTNQGGDGNGEGNDGSGYKLVSIADAANKQGVSEAALANEVAKVTGKDAREVRNTKWVQATLPRLKQNVGKARINIVIYDKSKDADTKPVITKKETKPSFSITDIFSGNGATNVALQPSTTTYDDGAVVKAADVPQSFQNLLKDTLVAGNPDLVNYPNRLQDVLVNAFLNSWQQSPLQADKKSPNYLAGGFGISNSDIKNSYSQWPSGYATNTGVYLDAVNHYPGDFYRGGKDLKLIGGGSIDKIPFSSLKADVSKVDLTTVGTYPVVYTYTNPKNAKDTAKITVPVTVKSANSPVFVFPGGNNLTLPVGDQFNPNDYKVVGNQTIYNQYNGDYSRIVNGEGIAKDSSGKPIVTITGQVDVNQPGIYQLTYEATNLSGIKAKLVRQITVLPSDKKPENKEWQVSDFKSIGYVNYVPGYGINVWDAPGGKFTGQRLAHSTAWKIFEKAVNGQGEVYYKVGKNQWLDGKYVAFNPVSEMESLKGIAVINYVPGYGVNLWKTPTTTGGYYQRKLADKSRWKVFGKQNDFYNVGKDQWIQGKYAKFETK